MGLLRFCSAYLLSNFLSNVQITSAHLQRYCTATFTAVIEFVFPPFGEVCKRGLQACLRFHNIPKESTLFLCFNFFVVIGSKLPSPWFKSTSFIFPVGNLWSFNFCTFSFLLFLSSCVCSTSICFVQSIIMHIRLMRIL